MSIELNQIDHREFQLGQIDIKEYDIGADRIIRLPLDKPKQEVTINPSIESQVITPELGKELSKVVVNPVDSTIDSNIIPRNIRAGVSVLGVDGDLQPDKPDQDKTVVPTKERQEIVADNGYELAKVLVEPIPDEYIKPEGTLDIANNGIYNVKDYANVAVLVGAENKLAEFLSNKNITINASDFGNVTQIRQYCFYGSNIVGVEMPDTITSIDSYAFYSCGMMSQCKLSKNLTSIGSSAFRGSGIVNIDLPSGLNSIGNNAFQFSNSLKNIIIPSSLISFGNYAFQNCPNLKSIVIQEGVTKIGDYAFQSCTSLVELVIPTTITYIGTSAFGSCTKLKTITIPSGVKTLNNNTFSNCSSLEKVSFLENSQLATISGGAFYLCSKVSLYDFRNCTKVPSLANVNALQHSVGCQIVVPDALYDTWTTASVWSTLTDVVWVKASEYVEE